MTCGVMTHTPTPWQIDPYSDETIAICTDGSGNHEHVATLERRTDETGRDDDTEARREADADFILRACNAHDDLLAAGQDWIAELTERAIALGWKSLDRHINEMPHNFSIVELKMIMAITKATKE
mgnify:CR=1 FL=1